MAARDDPNEADPGRGVDITIKLPTGVITPPFTVPLNKLIREVIEDVVEKFELPEDRGYNLYVTTAVGRVIMLERNCTVEEYVLHEERLLTCYSSIDLSILPPTPNLELNVQLREQGGASSRTVTV